MPVDSGNETGETQKAANAPGCAGARLFKEGLCHILWHSCTVLSLLLSFPKHQQMEAVPRNRDIFTSNSSILE